MRFYLFVLLILGHLSLFSQDTLSLMAYNLYRFPEKPPVNREYILHDILGNYQPDLLMVCELITEAGADKILNTSLNGNTGKYARATFVYTQSDSTDPLHQMVFYNKGKLILMQQQTYPTKVRDINHYTFLLNTEDLSIDSIFLEVFVAHLKSSEGAGNRLFRLGMVDTFFKKLEAVPDNRYILFGGDFNFYSSYNESAYQKLVNTNNATVMVDPIHMPGKWNNNDSFTSIHTQATRLTTDGFGLGGASGGMDDRFDFIMMSKNFEEAGILQYIPGSYHAYGNNGNCYNNRIDAFECNGIYPLDLREKLYNMSDHLPVVMQLKVAKQFSLSIRALSKGEVLQFLRGNVTYDYLEISISNNEKNGTFNLYNNLGQLMLVPQIRNGSKVMLDVSALKPGMYYLEYRGKNREVVKVLKL